MCGIAGSVNRRERASGEATRRQLDTVSHRGPDATGHFTRGRASVGQNRLAVIDLVHGDPPICVRDGTLGVVLNGEIYNFRELRADLERIGHVFTTNGDTEVIAHLAEDHPPAEVARLLDGMFAFAYWDSERERLVVGRDRLGKKPLYWWQGADVVVFGSEIKAVLAHPDVPRDLDTSVVGDYLRFGYVPTPRTFFHGVAKLPPGCVLIVDADLRVEVQQYWSPPLPGDVERLDVSFPEAAALVRDGLDAAVRRRLVADVPLGAFLSGGIDSSAVVASMAASASTSVRTFTIGFDDADGFDERRWARMVADRFGTEHTEFVVEPHAVDLVEDLVHHHDEPFGDSSAVPTWLLSQLTRAHVTVALCGDGGDELFAGYERFAAGVVAARLGHVPVLARRSLAGVASALPDVGRLRSVARFLRVAERPMPDAYLEWISYVPGDLVERLAASGPGLVAYRAAWDSTAGGAPLDRLLHLNLTTYLLDDLLPKVDRTSMAHALEVRAPFLDDTLLSLALRLPPRFKQRGLSLKRVLRQAMRGVLPDEVLDRPKRGFGVPLDRWFRGDLAALLDDRLGPSARLRQLVDGRVVDELLASHARGQQRGHALWTLLTLELFLRREGW